MPHKNAKKPRAPERDYSHRALLDKLGVKPGGTTRDRLFTLETVNCLGACALGPIVVTDGEYSGQMTAQKADQLLKNITRSEAER